MGRAAEERFRKAILSNFGCESRFIEAVPIVEPEEGPPIVETIVHVFGLQGHPQASRCYAWSSGDSEVTTVLHQDEVQSARDAVRCSILMARRR